ncbi:MAG: CAP domain-containing protein, partial [Parasphingorhabdus sp.]
MPRISAEEQLAIELINDARLNPSAEAARQGYDINEGLADGTITLDPKQPLAVNMDLNSAAIAHSNWMLDENVFAHEGEGDSSPTDRVSQTDYDLSGSWMVGENLAFATTDPSSDQSEVTNELHDNLFASKHHRENIMEDEYTELGVGQTIGEFETDRGSSTVGMQTVNYGRSGDGKFLTGVAVNDADSDQAYDIGEGVEGVTFSAGGQSTDTAEAGGYSLDLSTAEPDVDVAVTHGGKTMNVSIAHEGQNVKLDLYDGDTLASSGTMSLGEGAKNGRLLGEND